MKIDPHKNQIDNGTTDMEYVQVITTTESKQNAKEIAIRLLEEKAAACVQISGPITSYFWWNGKIDEAEEYYVVAKTVKSNYKKIEKLIKELHPYELPEIISMDINEGSASYLKWIQESINRS